MDAIYIPQLAQASKPVEEIEVKEFFPDLNTLTPVRGNIRVEHRGNFLQVTAKAEAIMTLCCNRCLQQYNTRILVDTSEIINHHMDTSIPAVGCTSKCVYKSPSVSYVMKNVRELSITKILILI